MIKNPPAFPRAAFASDESPHDNDAQTGMTLLDWFAGQALPVLLNDPGQLKGIVEIARAAYGMAEAMLEIKEEYKVYKKNA